MATVVPRVITSPYPRTRLPLILYSVSILLAIFLICNVVYCSYYQCKGEIQHPIDPGSKHLLQYFPTVAAPVIILISLSWLLIAFNHYNPACVTSFNFMEMPSAVFCSLLGGVSAVIEIHFSINGSAVDWSDQWLWSATSSVILCLLHAAVAFTLQ